MLLTIRKGDDTPLSKNFLASEFYSKKANAPASHAFYSELVEAVQFLRDYYDTPWRITSTYRPDSPGSQHRECRAVDSQPTDRSPVVLADLQRQLSDPSSEVFIKLRRLGITGFGIYDTFCHLDVRIIPRKHKDRFGTYAIWDDRKKKALTTKLASPKIATPTPTTMPLKTLRGASSLAL
jgi:hypothetical protein